MWIQQLVAPRTFDLKSVVTPTVDDLSVGQVLIKLSAGGICGSDLPYYKGKRPNTPGFSVPSGPTPPGLPLHEVVGTVVAGRESDLSIGARVVGWATGVDGLAEFVITRISSLVEIDGALTPSQAVSLQPLACVINAVDRLPRLQGASATILGVGPIGALFAHVLKSRGVTRVVGIDVVDRSDIADSFGIDEVRVLAAESWAAECDCVPGLRTDIVIEAIGHQSASLHHAVEAAAHNGTIFYFGVPDEAHCQFPIEIFLRRNATLMAGYTDESLRRGALHEAVAYVRTYPDVFARYVTHEVPASRAGEAFALAAFPTQGQLKVTVVADSLTVAS